MKSLTIALATLVTLISCNPSKLATKKVNKAYELDANKVAQFCTEKFPIITIETDTVVVVEYDFIEIECPPVQKPEWILKKDSAGSISKHGVITYKKSIKRGIVRVDTMPTKVKVKTPIVTKVVTKYVKDSALIKMLSGELKNCQTDSSTSLKKLDKKNDWIKWLIVALGISIILNILFITNHR